MIEETFRQQGCSWQLLADAVLRMAASICKSRAVQKIQVLSHTQSCLKSRPQQPFLLPWMSEQKTVLIGKYVLLLNGETRCTMYGFLKMLL